MLVAEGSELFFRMKVKEWFWSCFLLLIYVFFGHCYVTLPYKEILSFVGHCYVTLPYKEILSFFSHCYVTFPYM